MSRRLQPSETEPRPLLSKMIESLLSVVYLVCSKEDIIKNLPLIMLSKNIDYYRLQFVIIHLTTDYSGGVKVV
ncbi:unnamed protein product [Ambrosiozyma monospora]|uniref:Unnamed protein product n=1 Tax=Ambrosiozyma monospora TaxID=43982 RepID=A0A9W6WFS2_AMBMO|nr:unnamed protein product [Ambrosiozyma monospora]